MYDILWERRAFESLNDIHSFIVSINFQGCANKHFMLWIKPVWTKINAFLDVERKILQFAGLIMIATILKELNDAYFHHVKLYHWKPTSKLGN